MRPKKSSVTENGHPMLPHFVPHRFEATSHFLSCALGALESTAQIFFNCIRERKRERPPRPRAIPSHFLPLLCLLASASGTSALIFVNIRECDESSPCRCCEGDCKGDDSGCLPGLRCFERKGDEAVPGCKGKGQGEVDYCYLPEEEHDDQEEGLESLTIARQCDQFSPCGRCEGDCDSDAGCLPGLRCFERDKDEDVPGCSGNFRTEVDYCYDPDDESVKEDVVNQDLQPSETTPLTYLRSCDKGSQCEKCSGECSDDTACATGLKCFERRKKEAVPGCDGNGKHGMNYCYDPDDTNVFPTKNPDMVKTPSPTQRLEGSTGQNCLDSEERFDFMTDKFNLKTGATCNIFSKAKDLERECNLFLVGSERTVREVCPQTCGECSGSTGSKMATNEPSHDATLSPSLRPSYSLSFATTVPSPPPGASSDLAELENMGFSLSPMTLNLTFLTVRRTKATSDARSLVIVVDENDLLSATIGALTSTFRSIYPSFQSVVLEMLFDGEHGWSGGDTTVSYVLNGFVYFVDDPTSAVISRGDLDETALGALNDDEFLDMLRRSGDPVLASVHGAEAVPSAAEGDDDEGGTDAPPRDADGSSRDNGDGVKVIAILVPVAVALAALAAAGALALAAEQTSVLRKEAERSSGAHGGAPPREIIPAGPAAKDVEAERKPLAGDAARPYETEGGRLRPEESARAAPSESAPSGVAGAGREVPEVAYVYARCSNGSGTCEESRSVSSYGTDGMSVVGLSRMSHSVVAVEGSYNDEPGSIHSTEMDFADVHTQKNFCEIQNALDTSEDTVDPEDGPNEDASRCTI